MPASDEQWTWQCDRVIPSDTAVGRRLLDDVLRQLETLHWGRRDIFGVHLAVDEALVNAILHGNAADEREAGAIFVPHFAAEDSGRDHRRRPRLRSRQSPRSDHARPSRLSRRPRRALDAGLHGPRRVPRPRQPRRAAERNGSVRGAERGERPRNGRGEEREKCFRSLRTAFDAEQDGQLPPRS